MTFKTFDYGKTSSLLAWKFLLIYHMPQYSHLVYSTGDWLEGVLLHNRQNFHIHRRSPAAHSHSQHTKRSIMCWCICNTSTLSFWWLIIWLMACNKIAIHCELCAEFNFYLIYNIFSFIFGCNSHFFSVAPKIFQKF